MAWSLYGRPFASGELANTNAFVCFRPNHNMLLRAVRTWVIVNNDPTFTDLRGHIYSTDEATVKTPKQIIKSSTNILTKSEIITLDNGVKEIYFEFGDVPLVAGAFYGFVLSGSGYSYTTGSHLAWKLAWPDPVYSPTPTYVETYATVGRARMDVSFVGAKV